jgi:hypothetical protein
MAVLRKGPVAPREIFGDTSPYGSRRLVVESDGVTTVGYLKDTHGTVLGAVWIANHQAAPPTLDLARLNAGLPPTMPATATRQPGGRSPLNVKALEVVWFEEGDGVALLESGDLLCVIPVWSNMGKGVPGYSRDAITQGPFAFPFGTETDEFSTRVRQSRAYWEWRRAPDTWGGFQQSVLGHLLNRLGPAGHYWHDVGRQWRGGGAAPVPLVGVSERPSRPDRPFSVLSTVGMSCQRMPTVELYEDDVSQFARTELAVATTVPPQQAGSIFPWLAQYPWRSVTWFAPGDVVKWYHQASTFPLGPRWEGVLLLDDPGVLTGPDVPDMSGFSVAGDLVRWLWLVPITDAERRLAKEQGSAALVQQMAKEERSWVVSGP